MPLFDIDTISTLSGVCNCPYMSIDQNCNVVGESGVKIGNGINLSQLTYEYLVLHGVPTSLIDKISMYLGVKNLNPYNV